MADPIPASPGPLASARIPLLAVLLFAAYALFQAVAVNLQPDFFIYRLGAELGLRGVSPYDTARIRARVVEQFPDPEDGPDSFVNNCGYFLPPMAVLVYAPFAVLPWPAAKLAWAVVSTLAAFAITRIPTLYRSTPKSSDSPIWERLVPFLLVVNFLTLAIVQVGQTTVLVVGCVALGQWCFEKGRPMLGVVLWSVAFIKPHVALPLVPLAWYLGGWKRATALVGVVAALNVVGATIVGGSPLFLRDYFDFLASGHKAVAFNLAERNPEITSWNRLLYVMTGYLLENEVLENGVLIEQTTTTTLAGYSIWFGLVVGRCAWAGQAPSAAWAAAAAAVGAAWCPQVLAYEVLILAFAVPWLRELVEGGWRWRGGIVAVLLSMQLVPYSMADAVGLDFHRPLCVALLAAAVVVGPPSVH